MPNASMDGLSIAATSYFIGMPVNSWSEPKSYIICRALTDQGVIDGTAMIGIRRKMVRDRLNPGDRGLYQITNTQYGWIKLADGGIIDPCKIIGQTHYEPETCYQIQDDEECYIRGIDPVLCLRDSLPEHLVSDELFPLTRGVMRDTCSRLLGHRLHVQALTMSEAAYLMSRPLSDFERYSRLVYEYFIRMGLSSMMSLSKIKTIHPQLARKNWQLFLNDMDMYEFHAFMKK